MRLEKINYESAVFFGTLSFISVFLLGLLGMISSTAAAMMGLAGALSFAETILAALVQGIVAYIGVVFGILIYNLVAKKYPISWSVKKK